MDEVLMLVSRTCDELAGLSQCMVLYSMNIYW